MSWTAPATVTAGQLMTAAFWNTHVRDNELETAPAKVTTAGDVVYGTAANALARLGIGTALQVLQTNAGATAPEWTDMLMTTAAADWVATSEGTASTSYADLATPGPAVTITTGTKAIVIIRALHSNTSSTVTNRMGVDVSGATTIAATNANSLEKTTGSTTSLSGAQLITYGMGGSTAALSAGSNVFTAKYKVSAGTGTWLNREILVIPV